MLRRAAQHATQSCAWYTERVALAAQSQRRRHDVAGELYETLGVDRRATTEDIKHAFREVRRHRADAAPLPNHALASQ